MPVNNHVLWVSPQIYSIFCGPETPHCDRREQSSIESKLLLKERSQNWSVTDSDTCYKYYIIASDESLIVAERIVGVDGSL